MIINLDNALQVIGLALVIFLAIIGLIAIVCVFIEIVHESDKRFDDLNDFYTGCDPKKVRK